MKTLEHYAKGFDNNLNLIRFLAAVAVIFSHSYVVTGSTRPLVSLIGNSSSYIAVNIFFAISGFLVTKSYCKRNSPLLYIESRALRIFPGLVVAVLFSVFVVGALWTSLPISDYLSHQATYEFVFVNSTLISDIVYLRNNLPGVFLENPYPYRVNSPLWTLPYELWMYTLLLLIGMTGVLKKRLLSTLLIGVIILLAIIGHYYYRGRMAADVLLNLKRFGSYFFLGVFFYINRQFIPLNIFIAIGFVILAVLFSKTALFVLFMAIALVYVTFYLAYIPGGYIRQFNKVGDYSYGLYVYAFPIQQSLVALFPSIGPLTVLVMSLLITLVLAILSWHFIEKPALLCKGNLVNVFRSQSYSPG